MTIEMKVGGLERLDRLLKQLPSNLEKRVLQKAVTGAIREGRKEIKSSAPDGPPKSPDREHRSSKARQEWQRMIGYGKIKTNLKLSAIHLSLIALIAFLYNFWELDLRITLFFIGISFIVFGMNLGILKKLHI